MLEDSLEDAELVQLSIRKEMPATEFKLVMNEDDYLAALDEFVPDLVLSDNTLPQFNATEALELFNARSLHIPFILVTGTVSEEFAANVIKWGADDYILKDRLHRLPSAIEAAIKKRTAEASIKKMEQEILDQKIQEQKKITRAVLNAQEQERTRIGQELHDNINQILAGTKMYLVMAGKKDPAIKDLLNYPVELIDNSINEIRLLSRRYVTPFRDVHLKEMLEALLMNMHATADIPYDFNYQLADDIADDDLKLNIYRIIQEQINNIQKHAQATNVSVSVTTNDNNICLLVSDNGKGFDRNAKREGIGITNILNRVESFNGDVEIKTEAGKGCVVEIRIPYLN